jgi:hypothetical protein
MAIPYVVVPVDAVIAFTVGAVNDPPKFTVVPFAVTKPNVFVLRLCVLMLPPMAIPYVVVPLDTVTAFTVGAVNDPPRLTVVPFAVTKPSVFVLTFCELKLLPCAKLYDNVPDETVVARMSGVTIKFDVFTVATFKSFKLAVFVNVIVLPNTLLKLLAMLVND